MEESDHTFVTRSILHPYDPDNCPIRMVLDGIAGKWSILVLTALRGEDRLRFGQIRTLIPDISQKMLTQVLRSLERDGLVARDERGGFPRVVNYCLTPLGRDLQEPLQIMAGWAAANLPAIKAHRRAFDAGEPLPAGTGA